jgi:hypothetical protein
MAQTFSVARLEQRADVLLAVRHEVAVGRIEQRDRGSHAPREEEEAHAVAEGPRAEGVAQVVDAAVFDAGGAQGGSPLTPAELV